MWLEFTRQSPRGERVLEICRGSPSSVQLHAEPHMHVKILLEAGAWGCGEHLEGAGRTIPEAQERLGRVCVPTSQNEQNLVMYGTTGRVLRRIFPQQWRKLSLE